MKSTEEIEKMAHEMAISEYMDKEGLGAGWDDYKAGVLDGYERCMKEMAEIFEYKGFMCQEAIRFFGL